MLSYRESGFRNRKVEEGGRASEATSICVSMIVRSGYFEFEQLTVNNRCR